MCVFFIFSFPKEGVVTNRLCECYLSVACLVLLSLSMSISNDASSLKVGFVSLILSGCFPSYSQVIQLATKCRYEPLAFTLAFSEEWNMDNLDCFGAWGSFQKHLMLDLLCSLWSHFSSDFNRNRIRQTLSAAEDSIPHARKSMETNFATYVALWQEHFGQ